MENKAHADWVQARHDELAGPDSWLGMVGLHWLNEGANRVGSGQDCTVCLPAGPAFLGMLDWQAGAITWTPANGSPRLLRTDKDGQPDTVDHENLGFFIVDREQRLAARVRDRAWGKRLSFAGIPTYPFDPVWRVEAEWVALESPIRIDVPNVSGELKSITVDHKAMFRIGETLLELLPMSISEDGVFFVFRDRTSGRETYGAGRFLKAAPAVDGRIVLDFNRAFNPPCAFTAFATCPLPPPGNWLGLPIPAGERKPEINSSIA